MSLGFAFVRPQGLKQAPGGDAFRAFELVGDFVDSLLKDPEGARAVGLAFVETGKTLFPAFLQARQEPLRKAEGRIRQIFRPFADLLTEFLAGMRGGIAETLPAALAGLKGLIALARADSATRLLRDLIHLARTDLEITPEAVEALFRAFIDSVVAKLQARVLAGDLSEEALNRYEWGVNLKNLELLILEELDWPSLDPEILVDALQDLYRSTGFEDLLGKFERVLDSAHDLAGPLGKVLETVFRPPGATGGSVGAAAADGSPAPVPQGAPVSHYASWVLQKTARFEVTESTTEIAPIQWITYKKVSPHGMEQLALHTAWISDLSGMILHMISAEKGDMAGNILNLFWDAGDLLATITKNRIPNWAQWVFTTVITTAGGLERTRCSGGDDAMYPITLLLGDFGETLLYRRWRWLVRESLLSFVTLLNHDTDVRTRWVAAGSPARVTYMRGTENESWPVAFNNDQFHGLCYAFGEVGTLLLPAILARTDRMNYGFIGGGPPAGMVGKVFGGMAISWVFHYSTLFLARLAAGEYPSDTAAMVLLPLRERYIEKPDDEDWSKVVRTIHGILVGGVYEWAMQGIYMYLFTNGNTSGGTFSAQDRIAADFAGYPEAPENSPYKLPWAAGDEHECVQNPMGIWSHYPDDGQAYAYDFNHDAGTEVCCSRSGIITNMEQLKLNNNKNDWNHIEVMAVKFHPAGAAGAMPGVQSPPGVNFYQFPSNAIEAGTQFPPFWDVHGNPWPTLPDIVPLHPSAAILPPTSAFTGGLTTGTLFSFIDPAFDLGFKAVTYPAGSKFSDGTTVIPAGVVFAPDAPRPPTLSTPMYRAGTTFVPARQNFPAAPFDTSPTAAPTPGAVPAAGATFLDGVPIPAGLILPPDCGVSQPWLPKPHPATPLYLPGTQFTLINNTDYFNAGTTYVSIGTAFPAIPTADANYSAILNHQWFTPLAYTFCRYGHGLAGYSSLQKHTFSPAVEADPTATPPVVARSARVQKLVAGGVRVPIPGTPREDLLDIFGTNDNDEILGRRVEQGRVIMLSGDTGISAYNHLHTHVCHFSSLRNFAKTRTDAGGSYYYWIYTIPFAYADVKHGIEHGFREANCRNGIPRAMTWYVSENTRSVS